MAENKFIKDFSLFANDKGVSNSVFTDYSKKFNNAYINPTILEERQLNVTQMDVFSRLLMERILYIGSDINSDVANILIAQLLYLDTQNDETPITLYINSPGGSVYDGMGIFDTMEIIKSPISTFCTGLAASMASILLCAGNKGQRYALPHSRIMIHEPMTGAPSHTKCTDFLIEAEELSKLRLELAEIISDKSGVDIEKVKEDMKHDKWMTGKEALEYGLIDEVVYKSKK